LPLKTALILLLSLAPGAAFDSSPLGEWRTVDDHTHKPRGIVRLYSKNGEIFGRIESSFDPKEAQERCELCPGERHNQPVIGLVFLRNMKKHGDEYTGGDILDPETGRVYKCTFRLENGGQKLVVRGYIGVSLLGRSQVWLRESTPKQ
jgi:uncharacterized protein (DUF2147 family)